MRPRGWVVVAGAVVLLGPAPAQAADHDVTVGPSFGYSPAQMSIDVGDTVTWTWQGNNHSVTFDDAGPDSGVRNVGDGSFVLTFSTPGPFEYGCSVHGNMRGLVLVEGSVSPSPTKSAKPTPKPTTAQPSPSRTTTSTAPSVVRTTPPATRPASSSSSPTPGSTPSPTTAPSASLTPSTSGSATPSTGASTSPSSSESAVEDPVTAIDDAAAGDEGMPVLPVLLVILGLGGAGFAWWRRTHA